MGVLRQGAPPGRLKSPPGPRWKHGHPGPARAACTKWFPRRQLGDFFSRRLAGGPRRPPAGQPDLLGTDGLAPIAQEIGELGALGSASFAVRDIVLGGAFDTRIKPSLYLDRNRRTLSVRWQEKPPNRVKEDHRGSPLNSQMNDAQPVSKPSHRSPWLLQWLKKGFMVLLDVFIIGRIDRKFAARRSRGEHHLDLQWVVATYLLQPTRSR